MRLCGETVTVYNARVDPATRTGVYAPTVLRGVSLYCRTEARVTDGGLKAANVFTLRIPENVDADGKVYAEPRAYREAEDCSGLWTLQKGDAIVRGEAAGVQTGSCGSGGTTTLAQLRERYGSGNVLTVLGVTDNRRAPRGKHWRVTGA